MSMKLYDNFKISLGEINKNTTRTFLTILGIVIGIAAMIAVFSVGQAGQERIRKELDGFGVNRIWILSNVSASDSYSMNAKDAEMLKAEIPGVGAVCPSSFKMAKVESQTGSVRCDVTGTTQEISQIQKKPLSEGRHLNAGDVEYERKVVVLSNKSKEELFGDASAEGKTVTIMGVSFSVIGVEEGGSPMYDEFFLGKCYIPISVYEKMFNDKKVSEISVMAANSDRINSIAKSSVALFNNKYGEDSVKVINLSQEMKNADNIMNIFTLVISAIAGVSLLVGGIGIMNIMLVTIKERTREIGIRKALGATYADILKQFLFESILYSLSGGIIGAIIGCFMTVVTAQIIGLQLKLSALPIFASVGFAAAVGLIFGILPARKAAKLDPVEALRQE